ncbi:Protein STRICTOSIDINE SYNTHASE-LIKE 10 [Dichanthelium oligosanthes]|uniref:Protein STRICTOSIDINE SYNTHASE-LIKE 10 n=1 Tax=Dichanthelium oligosanthes TaxID=888268 RepID=A0A1E5UQW3_9POAL|nr:Protein STRICTOSIDINE SYNTHASE-LIKE 10 [Dichanthelium oligosanthes]
MKVDLDGGEFKVLAKRADSVPFSFINSVDVGKATDDVYFTNSSTTVMRWRNTKIMINSDATGWLLKYDTRAMCIVVLRSGLSYPNGVALSTDRMHVVVAHTGPCQAFRYWLKGPKASHYEFLADLPCYADNVRHDAKGSYWFTLNQENINTRETPVEHLVGVRVDAKGVPREVMTMTTKQAMVMPLILLIVLLLLSLCAAVAPSRSIHVLKPRTVIKSLDLDRIPLPDGVRDAESLAFDRRGQGPYAGVSDSCVLKWDTKAKRWTMFAYSARYKNTPMCTDSTERLDEHAKGVCGCPLGLQFYAKTGDLYFNDAYKGLMKVGPNGSEARPSSTTFTRWHNMEIMINSDATGRLLKYDAWAMRIIVPRFGLPYPNGVALSADRMHVVVAYMGPCQVFRLHEQPDEHAEGICDRPLGLEFYAKTGDLFFANAYQGLMKVGPDGGEAKVLAKGADRMRFSFVNGVDVDKATGDVYFTNSSTTVTRWRNTEIMINSDAMGRLLKYNARAMRVVVLRSGLPYPNGVALSSNRTHVMVAHTGPCQVFRRDARGGYWFTLNQEKINTIAALVEHLVGVQIDTMGVQREMTTKQAMVMPLILLVVLLSSSLCATAAPSWSIHVPKPRAAAKSLDLDRIPLPDGMRGAESLAFDCRGQGPYVGISDGYVLKWNAKAKRWTMFAYSARYKNTPMCTDSTERPNEHVEGIYGRPLGLQFYAKTGDLYFVDAYQGLMKVGPNGGEAKVLAKGVDGVPFSFVNGVDIDKAIGNIYFTDSSTTVTRWRNTEIMINSDVTGRLLKYDSQAMGVIVRRFGLPYPNGVALSTDRTHFVLAHMGPCQALRYWLKGPKAGHYELLADLPCYANNVRRDARGGYWFALNQEKINTTAAPVERLVGVRVDAKGVQREVIMARRRPLDGGTEVDGVEEDGAEEDAAGRRDTKDDHRRHLSISSINPTKFLPAITWAHAQGEGTIPVMADANVIWESASV